MGQGHILDSKAAQHVKGKNCAGALDASPSGLDYWGYVFSITVYNMLSNRFFNDT